MIFLTGFWETNDIGQWVSFAISAIFLFAIVLYIYLFIRRKFFALPFLFFSITALVSYYFQAWSILTVVSLLLFNILTVVFISTNSTELKAKIDQMVRFKKDDELAINYDKQLIYEEIHGAVTTLSKNRTGAIITLERGTKLNDVAQNGTILNAPLNTELLTTIFYKGTNLHDGAVIIRGSVILAASVYYTPTTKPLVIKYGSRHRAAIGISEISDSVTIVVSEETGRISIAYGGDLESVYLDSFKQVLSNYMENRPQVD